MISITVTKCQFYHPINDASLNTFDKSSCSKIHEKFIFTGSAKINSSPELHNNYISFVSSNNDGGSIVLRKKFKQINSFELHAEFFMNPPEGKASNIFFWFFSTSESNIYSEKDPIFGFIREFKGFGVGITHKPQTNKSFFFAIPHEGGVLDKTGLEKLHIGKSCEFQGSNKSSRINISYSTGKISLFHMDDFTLNQPCITSFRIKLDKSFRIAVSSGNGFYENHEFSDFVKLTRLSFINSDRLLKSNSLFEEKDYNLKLANHFGDEDEEIIKTKSSLNKFLVASFETIEILNDLKNNYIQDKKSIVVSRIELMINCLKKNHKYDQLPPDKKVFFEVIDSMIIHSKECLINYDGLIKEVIFQNINVKIKELVSNILSKLVETLNDLDSLRKVNYIIYIYALGIILFLLVSIMTIKNVYYNRKKLKNK